VSEGGVLIGGKTPPVDNQDPAMISRNPPMMEALSGSLRMVIPRKTETAGLT
jgi:hypothetical protein